MLLWPKLERQNFADQRTAVGWSSMHYARWQFWKMDFIMPAAILKEGVKYVSWDATKKGESEIIRMSANSGMQCDLTALARHLHSWMFSDLNVPAGRPLPPPRMEFTLHVRGKTEKIPWGGDGNLILRAGAWTDGCVSWLVDELWADQDQAVVFSLERFLAFLQTCHSASNALSMLSLLRRSSSAFWRRNF